MLLKIGEKNERNEDNKVKGMIMGHSPQYMFDKGINSTCNNKLWRVDVGMSRAFGKHDQCGDNKYRQIQVLEILNDQECRPHMTPYQGRFAGEGMGLNVSLGNAGFLSS